MIFQAFGNTTLLKFNYGETVSGVGGKIGAGKATSKAVLLALVHVAFQTLKQTHLVCILQGSFRKPLSISILATAIIFMNGIDSTPTLFYEPCKFVVPAIFADLTKIREINTIRMELKLPCYLKS